MEHISPQLVPILRQINTVHTFHSIFPIANIIISSTIKLSNWPLPFRFSYQNFNALPPSPKHATCPTHITILTLIILILHTMQVSLGSCHFSSALFTNILSLYSFLNKRYWSFTPRTWTRQNYASYVFVSIWLDVSKRIKKQKWVWE